MIYDNLNRPNYTCDKPDHHTTTPDKLLPPRLPPKKNHCNQSPCAGKGKTTPWPAGTGLGSGWNLGVLEEEDRKRQSDDGVGNKGGEKKKKKGKEGNAM